MGGGTRLAIAILVLFLAMVAFFFAFHPGGVNAGAIKNPVDILQWMFGQFDNTVAGNASGSAADQGATPIQAPLVNTAFTPIKGVTPPAQPGVSLP